MSSDLPDTPKTSGAPPSPRGSTLDVPPQDAAAGDIDPATSGPEEDDEARLPEAPEEFNEAVPEGPLAVGESFGPRYTILRLLGAGGMGAVYQEWDAELGAMPTRRARPIRRVSDW